MSLDFWYRKDWFTGSAMMRHCSGWVLCALLLILCANAKVARYEIHKTSVILATTQFYVDGEGHSGSFRKLRLLCCRVRR